MRYVFHRSVVVAFLKGDISAVFFLESCDKATVAVPQIVLARLGTQIRRLDPSDVTAIIQERFARVAVEIPRADWTDAVTQHYLRIHGALADAGPELGRRAADAFEIATAAHAAAAGATLILAEGTAPLPIPGLPVEHWGSEPRSGKEPLRP